MVIQRVQKLTDNIDTQSMTILKDKVISSLEEILENAMKESYADDVWETLREFARENDCDDSDLEKELSDSSELREDVADLLRDVIMNWVSEHGGIDR